MLVVERALSVLTAVAQLGGRDVGLTELSEATGLSPSTLHRHVSSLLNSGYLHRKKGSKRLELGGRALALGAIWLDQGSTYARIRAGVAELQERLGETSFASQLAGPNVVCIAMRRGSNPLHLTVSLGQNIPPRQAASARVILAHLNEQDALDIYRQADRHESSQDGGSPPDENGENAFLVHLGEIRQAGYDTCADELDVGVWAVAVPIIDPVGGEVLGALASAGPSKRFGTEGDRAEAISITKEIANRITKLPS